MTQNALTVILNVLPNQKQPLKDLLQTIGNDIKGNPYIRYSDIKSIHFSRFVMIEAGKRLLFTTTYDGPFEDHIAEILSIAPQAVSAIFSKCEGCPDSSADATGAAFRRDFMEYIRRNSLPAQTFYIAYRDQTVKNVLNSIALRERFEQFLNQPGFDALMAILDNVPRHVRRKSLLATLGEVLTFPFRLVGAMLTWLLQQALGALLPVIVFFVAPRIPKLSAARKDKPNPSVYVPYTTTERDSIVQNELTILAQIIPGRLLRLKIFLWILNIGAKMSDGTLSGVATIHFARWVIFDNGRQLLFESNYDGTWEQYIGDFIDRAYVGMDSIWGCCEHYPDGGARNLEGFRQIIIDHQTRADVFYSAYPQQSVKNILNNLKIADAVGDLLQAPQATEIAHRL